MTAPRRLHVFSDFDGTIVQPDTLMVLVERVGAGVTSYRENGQRLRAGTMSLRDAIATDMGALRVGLSEAADVLRAHVRLDPGFRAFAAWCTEHDVALSVLSAGFHEFIDLFLPPTDFPGLDVRANRFAPGTWRCLFRDATPFGHDKAAAVRAAAVAGCRTVYVGDGISDREPAAVADVVLARRGRSLAAHCRTSGIRCDEFDTFADVFRAVQGHARRAA
jgi:2,3-diketo-5-methylthio-1-phosphopentane phosphatase